MDEGTATSYGKECRYNIPKVLSNDVLSIGVFLWRAPIQPSGFICVFHCKNGPIQASFDLFSSLSHYNCNNTN